MGKHLVILTLDFKPAAGGVQEYLFQVGQRIARHYPVTVISPPLGALPDVAFEQIQLARLSTVAIW